MTDSWTRKACVVLALVTAGAVACESAEAARGGGGGGRSGSGAGGRSGHHSGSHPGHHRGAPHARIGAGAVFAPGYWPWWGYPQYYPYPVAVIEAGPPLEYIERGEQEAQPPGDWLYCAGAQGYFPYVTECPGGWERVPAAPLK